MSATAVTSAQAAKLRASSSKYPLTISGEQAGSENHVLSTGAGNQVKCKKATFAGTTNGASTEFIMHPTYSECTAFGFSATVTTTGCDYRFHIDGTNGLGDFEGDIGLVCSSTNKIKVVAGFGQCETRIGDEDTGLFFINQGLTTATYANTAGSPQKGIVDTALFGVSYDVTVDGLFCPLKLGEGGDGTYQGQMVLKGAYTGSPEGIVFED